MAAATAAPLSSSNHFSADKARIPDEAWRAAESVRANTARLAHLDGIDYIRLHLLHSTSPAKATSHAPAAPGETFAPFSILDACLTPPDSPDCFRASQEKLLSILQSVRVQQDTTVDCCNHLEDFQDTIACSYNAPAFENASATYLIERQQAHGEFLRQFVGRLPAPFTFADASRPWFLYWVSNGLSLVGLDFDRHECQTMRETVERMQNRSGGFGGGQGQFSHLATTYAATLALVCNGQGSVIDRESLYEWLGELKQTTGSFRMSIGGEIDVRAVYIVMVLINLLNLPHELPISSSARKAGLKSFQDKVGPWIASCQSYEGGLGGTPSAEAHGAYTFCGLGALCLLNAEGPANIEKFLDLDLLLCWLVSRQDMATGGPAGRTNKLVDACYAHWIAGCWSLVEAALNLKTESKISDGLFDRQALLLYIAGCSQDPDEREGGLRDKPGKSPDAYHTCYALTGVAHSQYQYEWRPGPVGGTWSVKGSVEDDVVKAVSPIHPVYILPLCIVGKESAWFGAKPVLTEV